MVRLCTDGSIGRVGQWTGRGQVVTVSSDEGREDSLGCRNPGVPSADVLCRLGLGKMQKEMRRSLGFGDGSGGAQNVWISVRMYGVIAIHLAVRSRRCGLLVGLTSRT